MFLLNSSPSVSVVVVVGLGVVFLGLILIILSCKIMSSVVNRSQKNESAPTSGQVAGTVSASDTIENKGEVVAAISAAVAENLGKDVSAIRILSIKKV